MKLAVSNIAWPLEAQAEVADLFVRLGVRGVEIAPSKCWSPPTSASEASIAAERAFWSDRGIAIVAAQSLLFGRPDLQLFSGDEERRECLEYLKRVVRVTAALGAKVQVFGSPKNRRLGATSPTDGWPIAIEFFRELAEHAAGCGTCVGLEANPPDYGADFLTRTGDALNLVRDVGHPGLGLHLDAACSTMVDENPDEVVALAASSLRHFHISEPNLEPVGEQSRVPHAAFAAALRGADYQGWVSIEMRQPDPFNLSLVEQAVRFAKKHYGDV